MEGVSQNGEAVRGESNSTNFAAIHGIGLNPGGTGAGAYGESRGKGVGVLGVSVNSRDPFNVGRRAPPSTGVAGLSVEGVGILGVSQDPSDVGGDKEVREAPSAFVGVVGLSLNPAAATGAGIWGHSDNVEGVHGQTNSLTADAVVGISMNPNGSGAAVSGLSLGPGPAGFLQGNVAITGNLTVSGDILLPGADCAEQLTSWDPANLIQELSS